MMQVALALLLSSATASGQVINNCHIDPTSECQKAETRPLPDSVEAYLALRDAIGSTPRGGAVLALYALMVRENDPALGAQLTVLALDADNLTKSNGESSYKGYTWSQSVDYHLKRFEQAPYLARSYAAGATPANGYAIDPASVGFWFRAQTAYTPDPDSGQAKVFVCSSGADSCRSILLKRNSKGWWKVSGLSSISVGVRPPKGQHASPDVDDAL